MKKPQQIEYEGPVEIAPGRWAADTGDRWHAEMPRAFWTAEARHLFKAAEAAGIVAYCWEASAYFKGEGITKAQLAYWCIKASTYLGIDRGGTTNWRPFEAVFGRPAGVDFLTGEKVPASTPLKACLHNIDYTTQAAGEARQDYTAPIDLFFENLKTSTNGK